MKKRICPICDQPMDRALYCKHCRRFVRNARVVEINYYLNERHLASEIGCSFHGDAHGESVSEAHLVNAAHTAEKARKSQPQKQERPPKAQTSVSKMSGQPRPMKKTATPQQKQNVNRFLGFLLVGGIWLLSIAGGFVIDAVSEIWDGFTSGTPEIMVQPESAAAEVEVAPSDWEFVEYTDEEVKAAGVACSAYGHLPITAEDLDRYLEENQEIIGYTGMETASWSSNNIQEDYSSFETTSNYRLDGVERLGEEDDGFRDLNASFDTATGEFHGLTIIGDTAEEAFVMAGYMTGWLKEEGVLSEGADLEEAWGSAWEASMEDGEETDFLMFPLEELEAVYMEDEYDGHTLYFIYIEAPLGE